MTRIGFCIALVLLVGIGAGHGAHAQRIGPAASDSVSERGRVVLTDWPRSLPRLRNEMGRKAPYLLPKIDSLTLNYRYAAGDSASQWSFVMEWQPGARVLYEGDVLPRRQAPSGLQMVNVELRAEVRSDGEYVGDMIVAVDSMALEPSPGLYTFAVTVEHDRVFIDTPGRTARRALRQGITLHDLVVERMGFVAEAAPRSERREPPKQDRRPPPRSAPSVYTTARIVIGWRVGPRPYYVDTKEGQRTVERDGETEPRTPADDEGRRTRPGGRATAEGGGGDDEGDDGEDDDTSLRVPALGAAAAIGVAAVAGGTVGLYGRGDTPIGLAAGYTHSRGGVQLQAAVNPAVIEGGTNQKLTVKALGFYDAFSSHVQPAVGVGVQINPARERDVRPAVSVGIAANWDRIVLFGGVDVVQATPEIGLTYNFRYEADRTDENDALQ